VGNLKAVLFDLYGTLAYVQDPISSEEISEFMLEHGYKVYPQSLDAASYYVGMIDYPKHGYDSWKAYLEQVFFRLGIEADEETLRELAEVYEKHRSLTLFSDAAPAVRRTKELGLKTAIVTTAAHFCFSMAIKPIQEYFDVVTTGYEAKCEKSNPDMHKQTLKKLGVLPQETIMIGDKLLVDIRIPRKLGMYTIQLDRTRKARKSSEADVIARTLSEAVDRIEKWQNHDLRLSYRRRVARRDQKEL
jgi:HAD superfamily hydrolase (TIGR01549 family)